MAQDKRRAFALVLFAMLAALFIAACSGGGDTADSGGDMEDTGDMEHSDEQTDTEHDAETMDDMEHDVPEDAAAMENPVEATDESVAAGADIYAGKCAACHGENGEGDGPAGAALTPPPANLHEDHVAMNSDGALFYIIANGVDGTGMPGWSPALSDEDIWNVVNFMRTFE